MVNIETNNNIIKASLMQSQNTINATVQSYVDATTTKKGIVRLATEQEVEQGLEDKAVVTPNDLSKKLTWGNIKGTLSEQQDLNTILNNKVDTTTLNITVSSLNLDISNLSNNKQDKLISGQNIKTINNISLLGSGDISLLTSQQYGTIIIDI